MGHTDTKDEIMKKYFVISIVFLIFLFASLSVSAGLFSKDKEVWMKVNQTEYYVPLNVQGGISFEITNDFDSAIDSLFTFTVTQSINQGNVHSTSSNSQTKTMSIAPKNQTMMLGVGPSSQEGQLQIDIQLTYADPKTSEQKTSILNGIIVHFINVPQDNQSQSDQQSQQQSQQNQKNPEKRSTTQSQSQANQNQNAAQQNQNMMQQLQQQLSQMQNPNQNQNAPTQTQAQQNLQNNQVSSDMNALKQQMQQEQQQQQEQEQNFKQNLAKNQEFLNENQKLEQQGYKLQSLIAQADSNNSGKFSAEYKNDNGESAYMQGEMTNNSMQNMASQTKEQRDAMKSQMLNSSEYNKINDELQKNGYNFSNLEYGMPNSNNKDNITKTTVTASYVNQNNETVHVTADFINETLKKIDSDFEKENKNNLFWWILVIALIAALITGLLLYYNRKKPIEPLVIEEGVKEEPEFDYMSYCKKEIESAKELFMGSKEDSDKKESYAKCANALRVFYSHKFGDKSEIVNQDALKIAKKHKFSSDLLNDTLNLCLLVEFARYKPNKDDFDEIYKNSSKIIENKFKKK